MNIKDGFTINFKIEAFWDVKKQQLVSIQLGKPEKVGQTQEKVFMDEYTIQEDPLKPGLIGYAIHENTPGNDLFYSWELWNHKKARPEYYFWPGHVYRKLPNEATKLTRAYKQNDEIIWEEYDHDSWKKISFVEIYGDFLSEHRFKLLPKEVEEHLNTNQTNDEKYAEALKIVHGIVVPQSQSSTTLVEQQLSSAEKKSHITVETAVPGANIVEVVDESNREEQERKTEEKTIDNSDVDNAVEQDQKEVNSHHDDQKEDERIPYRAENVVVDNAEPQVVSAENVVVSDTEVEDNTDDAVDLSLDRLLAQTCPYCKIL